MVSNVFIFIGQWSILTPLENRWDVEDVKEFTTKKTEFFCFFSCFFRSCGVFVSMKNPWNWINYMFLLKVSKRNAMIFYQSLPFDSGVSWISHDRFTQESLPHQGCKSSPNASLHFLGLFSIPKSTFNFPIVGRVNSHPQVEQSKKIRKFHLWQSWVKIWATKKGTPGCLLRYIGDEILPSYFGIIS